MDCHTPDFPVLHYLLEIAQTHVHWVDDAIQLSYPLSPPSPPASIFPSIRVFPTSLFFTSHGQSIGASASASILPMNIQGWFPLGFTGLISLLSKGCSRVFSSTTVGKLQFFGTQPSLQSIHNSLTSIHNYWKKHGFDYMDLCQRSDIYAF